MLESTDTTRPVYLTPEGTYQFTCKELPLKKPTSKGNNVYFIFKFSYLIDDEKKTHTEFLMPWDLPPLLKAFGFKEEPAEKNKFVWDRQECVGKTITAKIIHQADKKDANNIRSRMVNITELPF